MGTSGNPKSRSRTRPAILAAVVALLGMAVASPGPVPAQGARTALVLNVDGAIGPATAEYIAQGLRTAAERQVPAVVLKMNTPGGLDTSMREIIRGMLASPVPVIVYVGPSGARAASAGTYILYASHVAAMAPGTNLGAATPVAIGGGGSPFPGMGDKKEERKDKDKGEDKEEKSGKQAPAGRSAMEAKVVNDAVAYLRSLAQLRGRNADWAEKAVREAASLPATAALEQNVIDLVAGTLEDVLAQAHGRTVKVGEKEVVLDTRGLTLETLEPNWRSRLLATITDPNVALILLMIGIYGLVFEFMNPGAVLPGTVGAICLLLGLYALAVLPVNYAGLGLMLLGIALMVAEAFTPSFGALGIGGAVAFAFGAAILMDTDVPGFEVAWPVIAGVAAVSLVFALIVVRLAIRSHGRRVVSGREQMVGLRGEVTDWRGRKGHVLSHGERWNAVSDAPLHKGQWVRVAGINNLVLTVVPDEDK